MHSLRPAYPRGIYFFGAFAAIALLVASAVQPSGSEVRVADQKHLASSPQILALDLAR